MGQTTLPQQEYPVQPDDVWAEYSGSSDGMGWKVPSATVAQAFKFGDENSELIDTTQPNQDAILSKPAADFPLPPVDKNITTAFDDPIIPVPDTGAKPVVTLADIAPTDEDVKKMPAWVWLLLIILLVIILSRK